MEKSIHMELIAEVVNGAVIEIWAQENNIQADALEKILAEAVKVVPMLKEVSMGNRNMWRTVTMIRENTKAEVSCISHHISLERWGLTKWQQFCHWQFCHWRTVVKGIGQLPDDSEPQELEYYDWEYLFQQINVMEEGYFDSLGAALIHANTIGKNLFVVKQGKNYKYFFPDQLYLSRLRMVEVFDDMSIVQVEEYHRKVNSVEYFLSDEFPCGCAWIDTFAVTE